MDRPMPKEPAVQEQLEEIRVGYLRWGRNTLIILGVLFVVQVVTGITAIYLLGQNSKRVDDIDASRSEVIRLACVDQNERNNRTIDALNEVFEGAEGDRRREYDATVLLINAISPKRDCQARVRQLLPEG